MMIWLKITMWSTLLEVIWNFYFLWIWMLIGAFFYDFVLFQVTLQKCLSLTYASICWMCVLCYCLKFRCHTKFDPSCPGLFNFYDMTNYVIILSYREQLLTKFFVDSHFVLLCFSSGCSKFLVQLVTLVALGRTSLVRRWRRILNLLVLM